MSNEIQVERSQHGGGLAVPITAEIMECAKLMAGARQAIPPHLRDNAGACLAICIQAVEWRMSPFAVANKSYVVNDRLAYESQLVHAVVEQRAPLTGRLRHRFTGEGDQRRCIVSGVFRGEAEPFEFCSAPFGQIQPKNSPLWKTQPVLQLYYHTSRNWARVYCPDAILGVYAEDELDREPPRDVGQEIAARFTASTPVEVGAPDSPSDPFQLPAVPVAPTITMPQAQRFWAIANEAQKTEAQVRAYLVTLGIESTKNILVADYEAACRWAEQRQETAPSEGWRR